MMSRKKSNQTRRPRHEYVYGTTKGEVSKIALSVEPETGEIEFLQDMVNTYTEIAYRRPKGEKILARIPSKSDRHMFEIEKLLRRDYTEIFAVDTSTSVVNGEEFSVTAVANEKMFFTADSHGVLRREQAVICTGVPFCFLCRRPEGNPETLGWCLLIDNLLSSSAYRKCRNIGIVVDSELGRVNEINTRHAPIRDQVMLPENMTLIFAADAAAETRPNYLIRYADAVATQVRDEILAGRIRVRPREVVGPLGSMSWPRSGRTKPAFNGYVEIIARNSTVL